MVGMRYKLARLNHKIELQMARSGYRYLDNDANRYLDIAVAASILLLTAPVMLIIAILIKLQDGGSVFYKGLRFGQGKREFYMYKFRTLISDAEAKIGGKLLMPGMGFVTPIGSFLRDTRLDELPQLFNVLKGDMSLIGPRPERPAVYEEMCKGITNYDLRFKIKPGVFGYSQLFTPHSASKHMRAKIDNFYIKRTPDSYNSTLFVIYSLVFLGFSAIKKVVIVSYKKAAIYYNVQRFKDLRKFKRIKYLLSYQARLLLSFHKPDLESQGRYGYDEKSVDFKLTTFIFDINEKYVSVITDSPLPDLSDENICIAKFIVHASARMLERRKKQFVIFCKVTNIKETLTRTGYHNTYRYLMEYEPASAFQQYKLDKYILHKSIL